MGKDWELNWKGPQVADKMRRAAASSINDTLGECVRYAKANHGGWVNRSFTAQDSIVVITTATSASLTGLWGSQAVVYMRRLEFEHGAALRTSAQVNYPSLPKRIRSRLK